MTSLDSEFQKSRRRVFGLAYRMLSSAADAEDIVQETYLRAREAAAVDIRSPEAFFVTIATRLCLDQLKSARRKRETYVGPWLPEPIADTDGMSPETAVEFADDLSFALLMTLERLSPPERAAFLMHDVFGTPFPDIARALGKSEGTCRQLASRARKAVKEGRPRRKVSADAHSAMLMKFAEAVASGDAKNLEALLAADVVSYSDGGGVRHAALNPITGAGKVARFFIGLAEKGARLGTLPSFRLATLNGAPAFLLYQGDKLDETLSIDTDGEKITAIFLVRNPDKLGAIANSAAPSCEGRSVSPIVSA